MRYLVVGQRDDVTEAFSCNATDKFEAEEKFHEWIREEWDMSGDEPTGFDVVLVSTETLRVSVIIDVVGGNPQEPEIFLDEDEATRRFIEAHDAKTYAEALEINHNKAWSGEDYTDIWSDLEVK